MKVIHDIGLLVARLALGLILAAHGWARWQSGVQTQIDYLVTNRVAHAQLFTWGSVILELVGALLLVLGLGTRIVAAFVAAENIIIIVALRFAHGLFVNSGGYEYNLILAALAFLLVCFGAGRTGVDALFGSPRRQRVDPERRVINDADPA